MKLLLDQGTPRSAAERLRRDGIDTIHTGEIGLSTADDAVILERGRQDDRVIVTLDADFHRLMMLVGANRPSVIRIRIEGLRGEEFAALVLGVLQACGDDLERGALVSVQEGGMRLRRPPLIG